MWRLIPLIKIPLIKMVMRMIVFGLILGMIEFVLQTKLPWFGYPPESIFPEILPTALLNGLLLGLAAGIAMALYSGLLHRRIYKPLLFRFALVIVGTTISLLLVQLPFHLSFLLEEVGSMRYLIDFALYEPWMALLLLLTVAKHVAIGLMSLYAAGRYMRETSERFQKSTGQATA